MGEGLSKVTFNLLTFDNPSLFPFHAFRENKRIYNYFFNKPRRAPSARKKVISAAFIHI